jgi:hypothetical protein
VEDHLFIELPGLGKQPLSALSETVFNMRGTLIEFFKNARGTVSHLIAHTATIDLKAIRKSSAVPAGK